MTSSRPYLLRALYDWIIDNNLTPYLLIDADGDGVVVPRKFVEQGRIVLNISLEAVHQLNLGDEAVELNARFSGKPMHIYVPVESVMAIYARENGKGMVFGEDSRDDEPPPKSEDSRPQLLKGGGDKGGDRPKRANLRVVK
ncbi:ClpXP protease specificity-enhancing factor [Ectothiorhodospiraceae bacterium BW-2]|nr:ClpXP protease specificity-enhancing factor [Ectothiorhodospiraceae bacterium BW-2]